MKTLSDDLKPLLIKWFKEEAIDATSKGKKSALLYNRILEQLYQCQHEIGDVKTLRLVQFIGDKTVEFVKKKLKNYCEENDFIYPLLFISVDPQPAKRMADDNTKTSKKPRKEKTYIPRKRSGGYAIMLALYFKDKRRSGLTKHEIIRFATPYCDRSFTNNPGNNDFYSAWNSIKSLEKHDLVSISGRSPKLYYLTDEGLSLASHLKASEGLQSSPVVGRNVDISFDNNVRVSSDNNDNDNNGNDIIRLNEDIDNLNDFSDLLPQNYKSSPYASPRSPSEPSITPPPQHDKANKVFSNIKYDIWLDEEYEIIIIIDNREIYSQQERTFFQDRLTSMNVKCEVRQLAIGDVAWIARNKTTNREVILNTICERKRLDDLAASIKDGRFMEQKNRLLKSSMKKYYYLVEENANDIAKFADFATHLKTAQSMTMTVSHFILRKFKQIDETVSFLASLTHIIIDSMKEKKTKIVVLKPRTVYTQDEYSSLLSQFRDEFENRQSSYECCHLYSISQEVLSKTGMYSVREMFILLLMTIKGVSLEKAITIQNLFPTPKSFINYYMENNHKLQKEKSNLLLHLTKNDIGNKKIGKALLDKIYEIWGKFD